MPLDTITRPASPEIAAISPWPSVCLRYRKQGSWARSSSSWHFGDLAPLCVPSAPAPPNRANQTPEHPERVVHTGQEMHRLSQERARSCRVRGGVHGSDPRCTAPKPKRPTARCVISTRSASPVRAPGASLAVPLDACAGRHCPATTPMNARSPPISFARLCSLPGNAARHQARQSRVPVERNNQRLRRAPNIDRQPWQPQRSGQQILAHTAFPESIPPRRSSTLSTTTRPGARAVQAPP